MRHDQHLTKAEQAGGLARGDFEALLWAEVVGGGGGCWPFEAVSQHGRRRTKQQGTETVMEQYLPLDVPRTAL